MEDIIIADVVRECVTLFNGVSLIATQTESAASAELSFNVDEQTARFRVWAGNLGVFAQAHASLDYRLRDNPDAKRLALEQLYGLQWSLNHITSLVKDGSPTTEDTDLDDRSSLVFGLHHSLPSSDASELFSDLEVRSSISHTTRSPLQDEMLAIAETIERLYRLSVRIRRPSTLTQNKKAEAFVMKDESGNDAGSRFRDYARQIITHRCPDLSPLLQERLSETILIRRKRFLYRQRHQQKLDPRGLVPSSYKHVVRHTDSPASTVQPHPTEEGPNLDKDPTIRQSKPRSLSVTSASQLQSITNTTGLLEARSTISTTLQPGSVQGLTTHVPPPPKLTTGSKEFQCPYCCMILTSDEANPRRWLSHVLKDLEPYVCLFSNCNHPLSLFADKQSWLFHLRSHTQQWVCPGPGHGPKTFEDEKNFDFHLRLEHREIFTEDQIPYIKRRCQRQSDSPLKECPFCHEEVAKIPTKDSNKYGQKPYDDLVDHVQRHLRNFALISLPWLDDVDDAEDASSGRTSSSNGDTSGSKDDANNIANEFEDFGSDFRPGDDEDLIVRDVIHSGGGTIREQEWGFIPSSILYSGHELDPILQQFLRKLYLGFSPDSDSIQGPILPCYMLPSDRSQICFGRETVIGKIAAALVAPDASQPLELSESGPRSGLRTLALCGPGGMGKTSVASGFVQKYKDQFDAVFWVHGDSRAKLLHDFRNIAIELGLVAKDSVDSKDQNLTRNLVKTWLIKPRRSFKPDKRLDALGARWLLVFDGVDDPELVSEVWPYGGGSILITSRDSLAFPNKLELGPLDTAEAAQFLLRLTKKNDDPEERANAQAVAQRVGGFPLALSQMAGIITSRKWTFSAFLQAYDMRESKEMGAPQDVSNNRLASVWAFEDLKHGRQLLNNLSMLDPDGIPERLLMSRPKAHGFNPQLGTHILYQQAKIELLQSSLIFEHRGSRKLSLHRLVQDVARMQMTVQQYCSTFYECVHILSSAWPYEPFGWRHGVERWSACEELFPHIERLLDLADSVADVDNGIDRPYEFARLLTDAGWYHHERGGSDDSARFSDLAQSILETLQDKITDVSGNPGVITKRQIESTLAELQHNKGCFATETNKPLDALKHHSAFNMMMLKELADGAFHDDMRLAISWNELGNAFMLQDLWYKGEECYAKSIQALRQLDKFDTLQLSLPRVNMATACWLTGRSTEAAEILTEALADREKVFGADDKDSFITGRLLHTLGNVKTTQGYFDESFTYHRRALLQYKSTLGNHHHRTADLCVKVAGHHKRLKHWELALALLNQALRVYEDRDVYVREKVRARFHRSQIFRAQERFELADREALLCLQAYRKLAPGKQVLELGERDLDRLIVFWSK